MRSEKVGQLVDYIDKTGAVHNACIILVGLKPGLVRTIWYEHPTKPGKFKHVHWIPHEGPEHKVRCWREKETRDDGVGRQGHQGCG